MNTTTGAASPTPSDLPAITTPDLLELYQQISGRVSMYNTEVLIQRMFAIRAELNGRFATLERELTDARAEVDELRNVLYHTRKTAADAMNEIRAAAGAPDSIADTTNKRAVDYIAALRTQLRLAVQERDAYLDDRATLRAQLDEARAEARGWAKVMEDLHSQLDEIGTPQSESGAIQHRINAIVSEAATLRAQNAALEADKARLDWRTPDTAPQEQTEVLACYVGVTAPSVGFITEGRFYPYGISGSEPFTHWMPLPRPAALTATKEAKP